VKELKYIFTEDTIIDINMAKSVGKGNRAKGDVSNIIKNINPEKDDVKTDIISTLSPREVFALSGYLAIVATSGDSEQLRTDTYSFSRDNYPKCSGALLSRKIEEWFSSHPVKYFIEERGKVQSISSAVTPFVDKQHIETDEGYDEKSIAELEEIKEDVKLKIRGEGGKINDDALKSFQDLTKLIHSIRYKSKEQLRDSGKIVQVLLPLQCPSCPLYIEEKKKLNL